MRLCTFLREEAAHQSLSPQACAPAIVQACSTLHMPPGPSPQAPSAMSGGKGPAEHPGFIVPQKEGTNYSPTLWSAQPGRKQRPVGWRGWEMEGGGALKKGERKPQDTFQSFSSNLGVEERKPGPDVKSYRGQGWVSHPCEKVVNRGRFIKQSFFSFETRRQQLGQFCRCA